MHILDLRPRFDLFLLERFKANEFQSGYLACLLQYFDGTEPTLIECSMILFGWFGVLPL